jgi:hypothetical protein
VWQASGHTTASSKAEGLQSESNWTTTGAMAKIRKTWVYSPPKPPTPKAPESVKVKVTQTANELVETILKPRHIKPPPKDDHFNYIVDIYAKWYRHYFYFCAKYAVPGPNVLAPFFEAKFARLEYVGGIDRFNLSFMRYTGEWVEIYPNISLAKCLTAIKDESFFHP